MDVDGQVYGRTGYQAGGVEKYLEHLDELRTSGRKALTASKAAVAGFEAAADDVARLKAWDTCIKTLETLDAGSPFAQTLAGPVSWALEYDSDNEKGMKLRAVTALVGAGIEDESLVAAARSLDSKNENGLLEKVVQSQFMSVTDGDTARAAVAELKALNALGFQDKEIGFSLNSIAARWCAGPLADREALEGFVSTARRIGSDDKEALKVLDELLEL